MTQIKNITLHEVGYLAHNLARQKLQYDEPIPEFNTRFPNVLESCLLVPFQTFSKKQLYPGLVSKAGILFYLLIKNHPFQNGNKRIAMTTLLVFLHKNGKWLEVDDIDEFYKFTMLIASGSPENKDEYLQIIIKFINKHLTSLFPSLLKEY